MLLWGTGKREEARIKARLCHEYRGRVGANCWNKEHWGRSRLRKQRSSDQLWQIKSEPGGAMTTQVWSSSVEFWLEREWGETWELKCICSQTQIWVRSSNEGLQIRGLQQVWIREREREHSRDWEQVDSEVRGQSRGSGILKPSE